jgi:hypothetical protein
MCRKSWSENQEKPDRFVRNFWRIVETRKPLQEQRRCQGGCARNEESCEKRIAAGLRDQPNQPGIKREKCELNALFACVGVAVLGDRLVVARIPAIPHFHPVLRQAGAGVEGENREEEDEAFNRENEEND